MWTLAADQEDEDKYHTDCPSGQFFVYMANHSYYYPGILLIGTKVLAEFRGTNRAVAVWDDLEETREAPRHKESIGKKLWGNDAKSV